MQLSQIEKAITNCGIHLTAKIIRERIIKSNFMRQGRQTGRDRGNDRAGFMMTEGKTKRDVQSKMNEPPSLEEAAGALERDSFLVGRSLNHSCCILRGLYLYEKTR